MVRSTEEPARFDAVVVGGGPAGSSAAYSLASRGIRTLLIDKSTFPREKLCGGLVTGNCRKQFERVFGRPWEDRLLYASSDISFFSRGGAPLASLRFDDHRTVMYFTMRYDFDAYLLRLAESSGVILKLGSGVASIDLEKGIVRLGDGSAYSFRYLVGADGANSRVAKAVFGNSFDPDTIGFGMEVEVPREHLPTQADVVEIDFAAARWGYGWVFPKRRTYTIGVGGIHRLNPGLRDSLASYLSSKGLHIDQYKVKGQYIPFGDFRKVPGKPNVLLCGDAAGTVDPITGEGIGHAIRSGAAAAHAISGALTNSTQSALKLYVEGFSPIAKSIRSANRWRYLIFPAPVMRSFAWAFSDAGTLQTWYLQLLAGLHGYDRLPGVFLIQLKKGLRKMVRKAFHKVADVRA